MEIKVLGKGELGSVIAKLLKVEAIDKNNMKRIKDCVIFNCTPAKALPGIITCQPKFIINCCKGVYKGKLPSDYLYDKNNLISIGGYYKAKHMLNKQTPIYIGGKLDPKILNIIKKIFSIKGESSSSRDMEMSGILKNIYLLDYTLKLEDILKEIYEYKLLDKESLKAFVDDYQKCIQYKSRNYLFGKMFYENKNLDSLKKLGLVEGYNSLDHITLKTPLIDKIKKMYKKN